MRTVEDKKMKIKKMGDTSIFFSLFVAHLTYALRGDG